MNMTVDEVTMSKQDNQKASNYSPKWVADDNTRPAFDPLIETISDYVTSYRVSSSDAMNTAYYDLLDSLACGFLALAYPACLKVLGPIVPGADMKSGIRVPGTHYTLDPVRAAFNIGAMIRWLDFNDTWLAKEWGHPSDSLGGILAVCDYVSSQHLNENGRALTVKDVLIAMIKAHEIQGILALDNSFNAIGFDHVVLVKIATTAVATQLLGGDRLQICNAISNAIVDGQSLRTYRHAPNTGSRKSWAAADATSRGVWLALMAMKGEMGYPSALSAPTWGMEAVFFNGKPITLSQPLGSYVMENILFKLSYPAEFHAQTAVECAIKSHAKLRGHIDDIERIVIETQAPAMRIINKKGKLYHPADRDHCLQYMVAIGLIYGELDASHYEDNVAQNPLIDALRAKMEVVENPDFSEDYLDAEKRSIANSLEIFFKDGTTMEKVSIDYPAGHRNRRQEGIPLLLQKFERSVAAHFNGSKAKKITKLMLKKDKLMRLSVSDLMQLIAL